MLAYNKLINNKLTIIQPNNTNISKKAKACIVQNWTFMNKILPSAGGKSSQYLNYWIMRLFLTSLIISVAMVNVFSYRGAAQVVTLREQNTSLRHVLLKIREQTGYSFLIREELYKKAKPISIRLNNVPLNDALKQCLDGQNLIFTIHDEDKTIVVNEYVAPPAKSKEQEEGLMDNYFQRDSLILVTGTVSDSTGGQFLVGATVKVVNRPIQTTTDAQGRFTLQKVPRNAMLEISYVGYKSVQMKAFIRMFVRLGQSTESMKEVVVTGLFERKKESFTGSTTTFSQKELLQVGNINVLKSLSNLDPSFRIMENLQFGSDPNRLEEVQMRGQTGLPDLNNEYGTNPNLPLFILDGFETNLQRVKDLDIYLVKSITLLKDAASKAVYGSRAANGVIVIETMRPPVGKLQVTYNYNLNVELPDLSSYNLADPMQKLQIEMMTDSRLKRLNGALSITLDYWREYDAKLEEILRGVNTYWLSQPLRNGYGQRHSLMLGGGQNELQYSIEMGYNDIKGVMEGSQRRVYSGGVQLSYRKKSISVNNTLRLSYTKGENSPYGSFQNFAEQNPYIRLRDENGNYTFNSPMYNGTVGVQDFTTEGNIVNNTEVVWNILTSLRLNARLGLTQANTNTDVFLPASHNSFVQINANQYNPNNMLRGSYTKGESSRSQMNTTLGLSYNKVLGKSTVFANIGTDANASSQENYGFQVVGFPNANLNFPAAAVQYAPNSRLSGTENKTRDMGLYAAVNYAFDDRYLADLSWRTTRSSQFGTDRPNAQFWSAGLGWNIHNEPFMKKNGVFNTFRITANTGYTGTQPVNAYLGYPVYRYQLDNLYFGQYSVELAAMANPLLSTQRKQDNNISLNVTFLNNRLNLSADYYVSNTDGLLIDINLPNSTGFSSFKANQGKVENRGIDGRLNYQAYRNLKKGDFVSIYATMGHNTNKLKELSNTLIALTSSQDNVMSSALKQRFEVGTSLNAIWAVPSLGIDPATGKEVFQKKDGSVTYDWDAADQIAAGDAIAKLYGNLGFSVRFSGWQLNTSFAYNLGGYKYNTTLLNKVENINPTKNVDARVFTSRWQQPGDATFFKGITDLGITYPTTRFVEKWNELTMANINLSYDMDRLDFVKRAKLRRLRASVVMDTPFVLSTVGMERGTSYPFARTFSFTLQTNF